MFCVLACVGKKKNIIASSSLIMENLHQHIIASRLEQQVITVSELLKVENQSEHLEKNVQGE